MFLLFNLFFITVISNLSYAQSSLSGSTDSIKYVLSEIIVYGERSRLSNELSINRDQINAINPDKSLKALTIIPGVNRAADPIGGEQITIRGIEQRRINVYLNGIPIRANTENDIALDGFLLTSADYINIEKGTPSLIYGANSSGNVMKINTNPLSEEPFDLFCTAYVGNNSKQSFSLRTAGKVQSIHYNFSGSYYSRKSFRLSESFDSFPSQPEGNRINSDQNNLELSGMITPQLSSNHLYSILGSYNNSEFGRPPSTNRPKFRRLDYWRMATIGVRGISTFGSMMLESTLYHTAFKDTFREYTDATFLNERRVSVWNDKTWGSRFVATKNITTKHQLLYSFDLKRDIHDQVWHTTAITKSTTFLSAIESRNNWLDNFEMSTGISYNLLHPVYTSVNETIERDDLSSFNYQIKGVFFPVGLPVDFHLGYSHTTMFPSTKELFGDALVFYVPNSDLKEEKSDNIDAGISYTVNYIGLNIDFAVFFNSLSDLLSEVAITDTTRQAINIAEAKAVGCELVFELLPPNKDIGILLSYSFLDIRNTANNRTSDYLPYKPKHTLSIFTTYKFNKYFQTHLALSSTSKQFYEINGSWEIVDANWLCDIGINSQIQDQLMVFLKIDNVLDKDYVGSFDQPQPGREFKVGLTIQFEKN